MAKKQADLKIDAEFEQLIPPHAEGELAGLEASILKEGCREPLTIWKGHNTILDGHNRYRICKDNKIIFETVEIDLPDRDAAKAWILNHQMSRRNLTPEAVAYIRGKRYLEVKQPRSPGRPKKGDHSDPDKTADRLASEFKVGSATIKRDSHFALALDKIAANNPDAKRLILSRDYGMTRGAVAALARMTAEEQRKYLAALEKEKKRPRKERVKQKRSAKLDAESFVERLKKRKDESYARDVLQRAAELLGFRLEEPKTK